MRIKQSNEGKITYKEFRNKVERFMKKTEIRDFCREYCKGKCCCNVKKKCGRSCEKGKMPITCSLFICEDLANLLGLKKYYILAEKIIWKQPEENRWKPIKIKIEKEEEDLLKLLKRLNKDRVNTKLVSLRQIAYLINAKC